MSPDMMNSGGKLLILKKLKNNQDLKGDVEICLSDFSFLTTEYHGVARRKTRSKIPWCPSDCSSATQCKLRATLWLNILAMHHLSRLKKGYSFRNMNFGDCAKADIFGGNFFNPDSLKSYIVINTINISRFL